MRSAQNGVGQPIKKQSRKKRILRVSVLLAAFAVYAVLFTHFFGHACPINLLFGVPCPSCGLTRAVLLIFRGDFAAALQMHALVYSLPVIAILLLVSSLSDRFAHSRFFLILAILIVLAFIGFYIYRMIRFFPSEEPMAFNRNSLLFRILRFFSSRT